MRIGIAIALCALVLPAAALAKGPTAATITGPGLAKPLKLGGRNGWRQGSPMEVLVRYGGFFQVAWGGQSGGSLAKSPTKRLGSRYRVVYVVPGPAGRVDHIRQDLYPFAKGGPLTYTTAGQPFFRTRRTQGGWFRAAPQLTTALAEAGLPTSVPSAATPATPVDDDGPPASAVAGLLVALVLAAAAIFAVRRRARPASA